jgi:hypothetical protein
MANMEASLTRSSFQGSFALPHHERDSITRRETFGGASDGTSTKGLLDLQHPPSRGFEADLTTSQVYMRSITRGPRAFSIATSTQLTQSWSVLSGISLSAISSIAVQALPIYASDIGNSEFYDFKTDYKSQQNLCHSHIYPTSRTTMAKPRISRPLSGRLTSRLPRAKVRALPNRHNRQSLPTISEPIFISSTYTMETIDLPGRRNISKPIFVSSTYAFETVKLPVRRKPEVHEASIPSAEGRILSVQSSSHLVLFLAESVCNFTGGSQYINHYPYLSHGTGEVYTSSNTKLILR